MSANVTTDKITETYNGQNPTSTTVSTSRLAAATSLSCANLSGWPTATAVHFVTYKINTSGAVIAGSQCDWKGIVSGSTIGSLVLKSGTDAGNAVGDVVEMLPTASWGQDLAKAIEQEHNNDGTHKAITTPSVTASGTVQGATVIATGDSQLRSVSLETIKNETTFDYIASGGVWSGDAYASTRNASMTALTCYINGQRGTISAVTARSFTASKDTYVDVLNTAGVFTLVYTEVTNNAASPALAANSIRLAIIVTGASNIAAAGSVNQGLEDALLPIASSTPYAVTDSLGNLICPRDPSRKLLGYRRVTTSQGSITSTVDITGASVPFIVPAGRKVKVTYRTNLQSTVGTDIFDNYLAEGGSLLDSIYTVFVNVSNAQINPVGVMVISPSAGLHTYKLQANRAAGSGTATNAATSVRPTVIMVELE